MDFLENFFLVSLSNLGKLYIICSQYNVLQSYSLISNEFTRSIPQLSANYGCRVGRVVRLCADGML